MRILIAEDDALSHRKLEFVLTTWGHDVTTTTNGVEALSEIEKEHAPPLAILDVMMPLMNGVEVCRRVRRVQRIIYPYLILLTAKGTKDDVVAGLEAGASDYVVKPFDTDELRARVSVGVQMVELQHKLAERVSELENALSRVMRLQSLLKRDNGVYSFGPFLLDARERRLMRNGETVPVTPKVFNMLLLLVQNSGHLIEKEELLTEVWPDSVVEENNLTVSMSFLRKALGEGGDKDRYIETVPKRGYRFVAEVREVTND